LKARKNAAVKGGEARVRVVRWRRAFRKTANKKNKFRQRDYEKRPRRPYKSGRRQGSSKLKKHVGDLPLKTNEKRGPPNLASRWVISQLNAGNNVFG